MCDKCQQELDFSSNPFAMMDSMRNKMEAMHRNFVSDLVNSVNQFMHHLTACKELSNDDLCSSLLVVVSNSVILIAQIFQ